MKDGSGFGSSGSGRDSSAEQWSRVLTDGHAALVRARRVFRYLPSPPRCKMCNNPFGGLAGHVLAAAGFHQSRKNPNLCTRCCDALPAGGAQVDTAVLFADVRGYGMRCRGLATGSARVGCEVAAVDARLRPAMVC